MGEHKRRKKRHLGKASKIKTTGVIVFLCVVVFAVADFAQKAKESPLEDFVPARIKGPEQAPLQIVEFADFQCAHCAIGSRVLREYMSQYPQQIRLTMKYFPLGALNSTVSAVYAECAARQDRFWPFHDLLFDRQDQWRTTRIIQPVFETYATEAGLNLPELRRCVKQEDVRSVIQEDKILGESYSIRSTPTYFINGDMVVGVKNLRDVLDEFLDQPVKQPF